MINTYNIAPMPKPRMTRADKWKKRKCVVKYFEWCDKIREAGATITNSGTSVIFVVPMPISWSKKKKAAMNGQPHLQRPDLDNLLKALSDAVRKEDCEIWSYSGLTKVWGVDGEIVISTPDY